MMGPPAADGESGCSRRLPTESLGLAPAADGESGFSPWLLTESLNLAAGC
jgi:hypothetical protein